MTRLACRRRCAAPASGLLAALALTCAGCGYLPGAQSRLVGVWEGRPVAPPAVAPEDDPSGGLLSAEREAAARLAGQVRHRLEFEADGSLRMQLTQDGQPEQTLTGDWSLAWSQGDIAQVVLRATIDGQTRERKLEIAFVDDRHFTARELDGDPRTANLEFERVEAP